MIGKQNIFIRQICIPSLKVINTYQDNVPNKEEKVALLKAGLGEKKILFRKNSSPDHFKVSVLEAYPLLKEGEEFELLRTSTGSRHQLTKIWVPPGGFTTMHLADESGIGQALCYVRPIQRDLELTDIMEKDEGGKTDVPEECLQRGLMMSKMRDHIMECGKDAEEVSSE